MKVILFVCGHNAGRSQMAESWFNHLNKNSEYVGKSAGTNIAEHINPQAQEAMEEVGISMEGQHPKPITDDIMDSAARVIGMGCGVECDRELDDDWDLPDPAGKDLESVRKVRDQVKKKVEELLENLG